MDEDTVQTPDDVIQASLAQGRAGEITLTEKKRRMKRLLLVGGALFLSFSTVWLLKPFEGGMDFGICRVFLELNTRYPHSLRLSHVENFGTFIRIWYTQVDPFGEYQMEFIQCYYDTDAQGGMKLRKVSVNRRDVDQEVVDRFNVGIPAIIENPPDLRYPRGFSDSLRDLKFETDKFRKRLF